MTTLEKEQTLNGLTLAGLQYFGQPTLGPDGNFWVAYANSLYKVTATGQFTQYPDSTGQLAFQGGASITVDGSGNLWTTGWNSFSETGGLSRVTTSGAFTDFLFTGTLKSSSSGALEMVTGPDGAVWFTLGSPDIYLPGIGIGRVDANGNITQVAQLPSTPSNLIVGPDGNFWFVEGSNVDKMTPAGAITQYTLPGSSSGGRLRFVVGPDGNFWAPFPYGQQLLVRFSVSGAVVSSTPLSYTAPWYASDQGKSVAPSVNSLVSDTTRYVYLTDQARQAVLRIDGSGNVTAYPTYSTTINIIDNSISLVRDAKGTFYLVDTAVQGLTQAEMLQGFTPLDTSLW